MDYLFKPPTQMQDNALQTGMTHGQQNASVQAPFAMEMRPYENARGGMPQPLPEPVAAEMLIAEMNYRTARRHLEHMRSGLSAAPDSGEPYHWLRNITGGGRATLSSKRNPDGSLRTDMEDTDYVVLEQLTGSFYDMADKLAQDAPREQDLMLYRGIRIPKVADEAAIEAIVSRYGDVIPSSASWDRETPLGFSCAEEGQDAVVFYMEVPPDFPLVMLSYPQRERRAGDPAPLCIPGQQEVLVGASTFSDVRLLDTEVRDGYRCYHMKVKLNAVSRADVFETIESAWREKKRNEPPKQPTIKDRMNITQTVVQDMFGQDVSGMEVGEIYALQEYPQVRYKLIKKGFRNQFERIDE